MTGHTGSFVWYELMTDEPDGSTAFYRRVIGWDARPFGDDGGYTILSAGERGVAGLMALPEEARAAGARPGWMGYIAVADVNSAVDRIARGGGKIHKAPWDIPGVGRIAAVADPQGAMFMVIAPLGEDQPAPPPGTAATIEWRELNTSNAEAGFSFYADQFGWTKAGAHDMGPMGTYQMFATGGPAVGGIMSVGNGNRPAWLFYVQVENIDDAAGRIRDNGGTILHGPSEVPGGSFIIQAADPRGAVFGLVGPRA